MCYLIDKNHRIKAKKEMEPKQTRNTSTRLKHEQSFINSRFEETKEHPLI